MSTITIFFLLKNKSITLGIVLVFVSQDKILRSSVVGTICFILLSIPATKIFLQLFKYKMMLHICLKYMYKICNLTYFLKQHIRSQNENMLTFIGISV